MDEKPSKSFALYLLISSLLVIYVGLCSPHWQHQQTADAWEHHRAVLALTRQMWQPGNPTYATTEPSVRYFALFSGHGDLLPGFGS